MPGAQWPALRCKHIPDRYEHLVRYVGWYSNRARGERAKEASPHAGAALPAPSEQPSTEFAARAKAKRSPASALPATRLSFTPDLDMKSKTPKFRRIPTMRWIALCLALG